MNNEEMTKALRIGDGFSGEAILLRVWLLGALALLLVYPALPTVGRRPQSIIAHTASISSAQRIEERSGESLTPLYRYYYDMPGNGRLLCRLDASNNKLFYLQDARGYTTHLANSSGTVVEQYLYDAFGNPTVYDAEGNPRTGNLSAYDNRYLFNSSAGYEWLPTGNMYYARARYYAPNMGRWLAPDPIGFAGGDINLYRYCNNAPVNIGDPTGLYTTISWYDSVPLAGHIGIGTNPSLSGTTQTYGLFSSGGLDTGANVQLDSGTANDSVILNTTAGQERLINQYIQKMTNDPGDYDTSGLIFNNCATFVEQALKAAGLKFKGSIVPIKLFHNIRRDLNGLIVRPSTTAEPMA